MAITKDEFDAWKEHPITRIVMDKLRSHIHEAEIRWMQQSWGRGNADPLVLADLRARGLVLNEVVNLEFEDI